MVTSQFKHLFSPFQLKNLTLPNRIVSTAHATVLADDGRPGPRFIAYQAEKAKGGCGLIIACGAGAVHPSSPGSEWGLIQLFDDSVIPHLRNFTAAVHRYDSKIICQMSH
ncbi:MAG: N-methylproline demethylase, partial [Dehalococcoidia bacterium]